MEKSALGSRGLEVIVGVQLLSECYVKSKPQLGLIFCFPLSQFILQIATAYSATEMIPKAD